MMVVEDDSFKITRYLTKRDLVEANNAAIREKRNKTIAKDFVEGLPEDFIFVLEFGSFGIGVDFVGKFNIVSINSDQHMTIISRFAESR